MDIRKLAVTVLLIISLKQGYAQTHKGYAPVNGLEIYYEIHGEGKPLLLLHGSYMTIDLNWKDILPELSKTHRVIAIEMQGHGRTADNNRPYSYESMADDAAKVLKHLKIDKADIIGYSLGGTVALEMGIKHPEVTDRIVIISSVYKHTGWSADVRNALSSFKPEFFDATPLKTAYDKVAPKPDYWHKFVTKLTNFDSKDFNLGEANIKAMKSPVLLIMGDNDGIDLNHTAEMYRLLGGGVFADMNGLPKSQLAIIPAQTHVTLMMQTDKLMAAIDPFLVVKKITNNLKLNYYAKDNTLPMVQWPC